MDAMRIVIVAAAPFVVTENPTASPSPRAWTLFGVRYAGSTGPRLSAPGDGNA